MTYVLFSTTNSFGSRLIRWATKSPVSHTAILKDNMVWESKFPRGTSCKPFYEWAQKNQLIAVESWPKSVPDPKIEDLAQHGGSWYDVGALLFLAMCYLFRASPKKNLWNHPNAKMCTEYVTKVLLGTENSTITPWELRLLVKDLNT